MEAVAVDPLDALPSPEIEQRCLEDLDLSLERIAQSDALRADFDLVAYGRTSWNPSRRFSPIDWPIPRPTSRPASPPCRWRLRASILCSAVRESRPC